MNFKFFDIFLKSNRILRTPSVFRPPSLLLPMRSLLFALLICSLQTGLAEVTEISKGDLRSKLFDLARSTATKVAQKKILFTGSLKRFGDSAFFNGRIVDENSADVMVGEAQSADTVILWKKEGAEWKVVACAVGVIDVCWLNWPAQYGAPYELLPGSQREAERNAARAEDPKTLVELFWKGFGEKFEHNSTSVDLEAVNRKLSLLPGIAVSADRIAGKWNTPRHEYLLRENGTYTMRSEEPHVTHGKWSVQGTILDFVGPQRIIYFGAKHMATADSSTVFHYYRP